MSESAGDIQHCLNCNAVLGGQYCGNCGQRARNRFISLWELISDAFGDLFELVETGGALAAFDLGARERALGDIHG